MKKLTVSIFLVAVFLMTSVSTKLSKANDGSSIQLTPRDEFTWTVPYVEKLKNLEAFSFETTDYLRTVSRGEFIAWMIRSQKIEAVDFKNPFQDVSTSNPYYLYIMTALAKGIIPSAEKFFPGQFLQRYTMGIWLLNAKGSEAMIKSKLYEEEPCILAQDGYDEIKAISKEACGKLTLCYQPEYQLMSYRHIDSFRMICPLEPAILGEASYGLVRLIEPPNKTDSIILSTSQVVDGLIGRNYGAIYPILWEMISASDYSYDESWGAYPNFIQKISTFENGLITSKNPKDLSILQVTQEIRKNIKWSNGDPVTSDDAVFGEYFWIHPYFGAFTIPSIKKIEKKDTNTVLTTYRNDNLSYLYIGEYMQILPREYLEKKFNYHLDPYDWEDKNYYDPVTNKKSEKCLADEAFIKKVLESDFDQYPINAGPYLVKEWKAEEEISLQANPNYLFGKPLIENIVIKMQQKPPSKIDTLLKQGKTDLWLDPITITDAMKVEKKYIDESYPMQLDVNPNMTWEHIEFNVDDPILQDVRVRQALLYSLDRDKLINEISGGLYSPAKSFLLKKSYIHQYVTPPIFDYNLEKAKELMVYAGWSKNRDGVWERDRELFTLTFMTTSGNALREQIQDEITKMWYDFGVIVEIENFKPTEFFGTVLRERQFNGPTAVMFAWIMSPYSTLLSLFKTSEIPTFDNDYAGQNYCGYSNKAVDKLYEENLLSLNFVKAHKNIAKIAKIVSYDVPMIPLFFRSDFTALNKKLKNVFTTGSSSPISWNCAYWYKEKEQEEEKVDAGDWTLPVLLNGENNGLVDTVKLSDVLKDPKINYVLLNFWASWCEPCYEEMPFLEVIYQKYKNKGLIILGISLDENELLKERLISMVKNLKKKDGSPANISYPILWDLKHELKDIYGITSIPRDLLVDKNNKIVYQHSGFTEELIEELDAKLLELMP